MSCLSHFFHLDFRIYQNLLKKKFKQVECDQRAAKRPLPFIPFPCLTSALPGTAAAPAPITKEVTP